MSAHISYFPLINEDCKADSRRNLKPKGEILKDTIPSAPEFQGQTSHYTWAVPPLEYDSLTCGIRFYIQGQLKPLERMST